MKTIDLVSSEQIAAHLGCTVRTLYNLRNRGVIAPIKVGRSTRWDLNEVLAQLRQHDLGQAV